MKMWRNRLITRIPRPDRYRDDLDVVSRESHVVRESRDKRQETRTRFWTNTSPWLVLTIFDFDFNFLCHDSCSVVTKHFEKLSIGLWKCSDLDSDTVMVPSRSSPVLARFWKACLSNLSICNATFSTHFKISQYLYNPKNSNSCILKTPSIKTMILIRLSRNILR